MTFDGRKASPFPDDTQRMLRARLGWITACCNFETAARRFESVRRKYSPDQPRVPAGNPGGGQWSADDGQSARPDALTPDGDDDTLVTEILRKAKNLNLTASPADYQKCLNICYPILERPKPPWSDRNKYDFHKCMNACLGINR